jgi:type I restriction enzyme R subunit
MAPLRSVGGPGEIDTQVTYDLDAHGSKPRTAEIRQWAGETVRTLYTNPDDLRRTWSDFEQRSAVVAELEDRGIDFRVLAAELGQPEADPFDLLCHLAYNAPLRTCRERANRLRTEKKAFFDRYGPDARLVLNALLDKYADHGPKELAIPEALTMPPISGLGNVNEIAKKFGGADKLMEAISELQALLYAA